MSINPELAIKVSSHHVELTEAMQSYARKKMEKMNTFFDNIQDIHINLKIEQTASEGKLFVAEATIHASGATIHAADSSRDMYGSIDAVTEKLEVQLKKHKEKLRDNNREQKREGVYFHSMSKSNSVELDDAKLYIPKPMTPEDAAELYNEKYPFLMFRNSKTLDINVIYSLGEGKLGLIEP